MKSFVNETAAKGRQARRANVSANVMHFIQCNNNTFIINKLPCRR